MDASFCPILQIARRTICAQIVVRIVVMLCPQCRTVNSANALNCTLCGAVLRASPIAAASSPAPEGDIPDNESQGVTVLNDDIEVAQAWPFRPLSALGIGLLLMPLIKQVWILNYIFNFLATLVHEIGHSVFAWLMGMPSIPAVGLFGGGVTPVLSQILPLCFAILAGLGWLAWQMRGERRWLTAIVTTMVVYALLAFTSAAQNLVTAGGVLFEVGGAVACFYWVLTAPRSVGLERPLYALWGWWMLLNRLSETWLMLHDHSYWDAHVIANSGLGEGLVNDLPRLCEAMNLSPTTVLVTVLAFCLSAVPIAFGLRRLKHLYNQNELDASENYA